MQSAFTVPLGLLVAIALGTLEPPLFFPASLIIVGAHYLTFISLYGMRLYGVLAGVLVSVGAAVLRCCCCLPFLCSSVIDARRGVLITGDRELTGR